MFLRFACFVASTFDQSDWLKLLGIAGAMLALYVLAKRLGGGNQEMPPMDAPSSTQLATSQIEPPEAQEIEEPATKDDPDQLGDEQATAEEEPQPRNIQIRDWNFATFEINSGPPARNCFADDLSVDLYDKLSAHAWKQTYFVATPAGLEKMLRDKKWESMFIPQTIVMDRYDINELRAAILDDLGALEEERGDVPPDASDNAVAGQ